MLVASWRNWLAEARLRRWRRPLEPKSVEQPATSVDGAAMHGRTAISLRWPRAALLDSLKKRAAFLFPARCGYRSGNASAENLVQSRQMRTSISLRWRSPMLDILARCNFKPKLACKTANNQKTYGKLKKCIGFAADVRSHTSRNNKNCMYFAFCEHHCIGQQRIIVVPKLATESSKSWWLNVTKLCYAPKRCKNLITKASKGPIFSKAPPSAKFQLPHHCPCIPL